MRHAQDIAGGSTQVVGTAIVPATAATSADAAGAGPELRSRGWVGWLISAGMHSLLLLIMMCIYYVVGKTAYELPPFRVPRLPPAPAKVVAVVPVPLDPPRLNVTAPEPAEEAVTVETTIPEDEVAASTQEQSDAPASQGREDAASDLETGASGALLSIGASHAGAGLFGGRTPGGRKVNQRKFHAPPGIDQHIELSLNWFKRHQSPDGGWNTVTYYRNCTEDPKCEPGVVDHGSVQGSDIAMTGYALLCFLGAGYDHLSPSKYRNLVRRGIDHLVAASGADGYLGDRNYENAIATMALAEAYGMTGDPALKTPAQKGVDQILAHQNQLPANAGAPGATAISGYGAGLGWDYVGPSNRNDSSVTGWNVMALKSALAAGLQVGNGLENAKRWLEAVWRKQNPDWQQLDGYRGESRFPYTYLSDTGATEIAPAPGPGQAGPNDHDLTCVGGVCAVFLGHHAGDPMLESLSNYVMNHEMPTSFPCNAYYLYYNTLTIFQCAGQKWATWNASVPKLLIQAQRQDRGCSNGSWDVGSNSFIGSEYGRLLTTAYCCLSLEVYYRYQLMPAK